MVLYPDDHGLVLLNTLEEKKQLIIDAWKQLSTYETFVFNKLLMGSFRIGVSQTLVVNSPQRIPSHLK